MKDLNGQVVYFLLPIDYISGDLTIAQMVFIRVLQQLTLDLNYKKYMTIAIAYKLYESKLLDSFNASERSMFTDHLQEALDKLREKEKLLLFIHPARIMLHFQIISFRMNLSTCLLIWWR